MEISHERLVLTGLLIEKAEVNVDPEYRDQAIKNVLIKFLGELYGNPNSTVRSETVEQQDNRIL